MPNSETSLEQLLYDIRRISDHREQLTEEKIKAMYKTLMKELKTFVAESFEKYADSDGRLYMANLDAQRKRAWFLNEIRKNCNNLAPELKSEMVSLIDETYQKCFEGMIESVKSADTSEELASILQDIKVQPDIMNQAVNNNISKLTLNPVLEKHRQEIIYQLQNILVTGLLNGDRYDQMAKRITERVDVSYNKAMNISRTESHRNTESGMMDCAERIQSGVDGSGYIYAATWRTMGDERVRPQARRKTKGGWKTYFSNSGANHMKMEGQTVKVGEFFNLGNGVKAKAPSQSGNAANDCNCRCFLEYNLMTVEEFKKATGKNVTTASVTKPIKQAMNENGIVDLNLQRTTNESQFDIAIKNAKNANKNGACVDIHPKDELENFKLFLSDDGMAGVAVKPDGDITAVFKNSNSNAKGAVNDLIITARANGGVKMDCYGQFLVNSYEKCGYVPVARVPFNADYVDDPFLLKTKPDVYVMMKNDDTLSDVIKKNAARSYKLSSKTDLDELITFTDYDEALKYRDKMLKGTKIIDEATDIAEKHYNVSIFKEPEITKELKQVISKTNGELSGLQYRLKTEASYTRKVEKEIIDLQKSVDKAGKVYTITKSDAIYNMRDVVRYTSISSKETLVADFNDIIDNLEDSGYKLVKVKNTFKKYEEYKGINCTLEDVNGYQFELQFHTPQSFDLKNGELHKLYEKQRLVTTTAEEKASLRKQMIDLSDQIDQPDNVNSIKSFNDIPDILDKIIK